MSNAKKKTKLEFQSLRPSRLNTHGELVLVRVEDLVQVAVGHSQVVLMDEAGRCRGFITGRSLAV